MKILSASSTYLFFLLLETSWGRSITCNSSSTTVGCGPQPCEIPSHSISFNNGYYSCNCENRALNCSQMPGKNDSWVGCRCTGNGDGRNVGGVSAWFQVDNKQDWRLWVKDRNGTGEMRCTQKLKPGRLVSSTCVVK